MIQTLSTGEIEAQDGTRLTLPVDTICIHSDSPGAGALARRLKERLEEAGIALAPLGRL